jgi:phosphatidylinositol glycan class V
MHYWTLSQLPNFIISLPVFLLLIGFCGYHILSVFLTQLRLFVSPNHTPPPHATTKRDSTKPPLSSPFLSPTITPHAIHAFILTLTMLFTSHVQIILRQAASMPITYWAGAWLVVAGESEDGGGDGIKRKKWTRGKWGRWWVGWSCTWGMVSLVLWVAFLPPA